MSGSVRGAKEQSFVPTRLASNTRRRKIHAAAMQGVALK